MSIETDLIAYLGGINAVTTYVGNRISMDKRPQAKTTSSTDVGALPSITVHAISGGEQHGLTGGGPHGIPRVQLSVWSTGSLQAISIREVLRNHLQGFSGTWNTTTTVGSVVFQSGPGLYEENETGGDQGICHQPIDLTIWFKQPIPST